MLGYFSMSALFSSSVLKIICVFGGKSCQFICIHLICFGLFYDFNHLFLSHFNLFLKTEIKDSIWAKTNTEKPTLSKLSLANELFLQHRYQSQNIKFHMSFKNHILLISESSTVQVWLYKYFIGIKSVIEGQVMQDIKKYLLRKLMWVLVTKWVIGLLHT